VAYFAQLAPLYAAYDLAMPLVVPRARLRAVDGRTARVLARLRLEPDDVCRPDADALAAARRDPTIVPELSARVLAPFTQALDTLRAEMEPLAPGLREAFDKTRGTVETALRKLTRKIESASLQEDHETAAAVCHVKHMLFPYDTAQERIYGLAYFAARYGERAFVERVLVLEDA
jgi:hypothetical protein